MGVAGARCWGARARAGGLLIQHTPVTKSARAMPAIAMESRRPANLCMMTTNIFSIACRFAVRNARGVRSKSYRSCIRIGKQQSQVFPAVCNIRLPETAFRIRSIFSSFRRRSSNRINPPLDIVQVFGPDQLVGAGLRILRQNDRQPAWRWWNRRWRSRRNHRRRRPCP